jgi:polyhydroxyalkanoate synthesis regulator protein
MKKQPAADGIVIIKKYANRRLYNTESSSYITLDHLATMTREGRDFKVVDAKTDEDITHNVLTQIIMEEESRGETMMPGYLEASMDSFRRNHDQFKSAVEGAFANSPFADIAKRNLAMFDVAAQAMTPPAPTPAAAPAASKDDEIAALRNELAKLQEKVEKLG